MRHRVRKGKLGLKTQHRLSLLKNLATELFRQGRIITTDARAKELKRFSEKLITTPKVDSVQSRRIIHAKIKNRHVLKNLFEFICIHTRVNSNQILRFLVYLNFFYICIQFFCKVVSTLNFSTNIYYSFFV